MKTSELLESQIPLIEELIRQVSRRYRLSRFDAEEFASRVRLHFVEHDYRVLREFRGQSSLRTFLAVVIGRQCLDYLAHRWGKWRPSAEARRFGPDIVRLERLVFRDGLPFEEACDRLAASRPREELASIFERLPVRLRRRYVDDYGLESMSSDMYSPDAGLKEAESRRRQQALSVVLGRLDPDDRALIKLRYFEHVSVADIARRRGVEDRPLYRHMDRLLARLRRELEDRGVALG